MQDAAWYALLLQVSGMRGHIGEQSKSGNKKCCSSHVPVKANGFGFIRSATSGMHAELSMRQGEDIGSRSNSG